MFIAENYLCCSSDMELLPTNIFLHGHLLVLDDVKFDAKKQQFLAKIPDVSGVSVDEQLLSLWHINVTDGQLAGCDEDYDVGYVVPINISESYHGLFIHVLLPLHSAVNMRLDQNEHSSRILMPAALKSESHQADSLGTHINMNTLAFYDDPGKHFMEIVRTFAGAIYYPLPMDVRLRYRNKCMCMKQAQFGLRGDSESGEWAVREAKVLTHYIHYLRNNLNLIQYDQNDNDRKENIFVGIFTHKFPKSQDLADMLSGSNVAGSDVIPWLLTFNMVDRDQRTFYEMMHSVSSSVDLVVGVTSNALCISLLLPQHVNVLHIRSPTDHIDVDLHHILAATRPHRYWQHHLSTNNITLLVHLINNILLESL